MIWEDVLLFICGVAVAVGGISASVVCAALAFHVVMGVLA